MIEPQAVPYLVSEYGQQPNAVVGDRLTDRPRFRGIEPHPHRELIRQRTVRQYAAGLLLSVARTV